MSKFIGTLLMFVGIAFGLWAGLWWGFVGGIMATVDAIRAPELVSSHIAFGIARVCFANPIGLIAGAAVALPGYVLANK